MIDADFLFESDVLAVGNDLLQRTRVAATPSGSQHDLGRETPVLVRRIEVQRNRRRARNLARVFDTEIDDRPAVEQRHALLSTSLDADLRRGKIAFAGVRVGKNQPARQRGERRFRFERLWLV